MNNSEYQQIDLIFDPRWNAQPVKSGQRVSDVVDISQVKCLYDDDNDDDDDELARS